MHLVIHYGISSKIFTHGWVQTNLSCNRPSGYFDPGGNKGGGLPSTFEESTVSFEDLEEFPALPDLTIPFLGGIH